MRRSIVQTDRVMRLTSVVLAMTATAILLPACDRSRAATPKRESELRQAPGRPPGVPTVELTEGQLGAVKIEPVGTYSFFLEREAVGNVSFDEDTPVVQAEAALVAAAAAFARSRKELVRVQDLGAAHGIAQKEVEGAIADEQTAAATLKSARDALRAVGKTDSQIDRIIATGRFDRAAKIRFAKWVVANVNESDSSLVRVGQAVSVKVVPYPARLYSGSLSNIYATIDPNTHRMTARAQVADPQDQLRPGMLADVTIRIGGPVDSPAVPTTAVVREGDGTMVAWVTGDRRHFAQRPLKLGVQSDGRYQVLEGLRSDDLLVVEGGVFLSNLLEAPPSD
jgi:cobalt-zinc-cadmium efflux system membrane fusion protein